MALVAACGGDATGPGTEPPFDFSFADPAGDTVSATASSVPKGIDLLQVSGTVGPDEVRLVLEFAEPVVAWSAGAANSLDGFVDFDLDENPGTGIRDVSTETGSGAFDLGADFYLDLRDDSGRLWLVDVAERRFSRVKATFSGTQVEVTIPRSELVARNDADNRFRMGVLVTAVGRPVTDVAPNASHYVVAPGT